MTPRSYLRTAAVAALVFIGAVFTFFSATPAGITGTVMSSLLALTWLTACCSLAGLALASIRR